MMKEIKADFVTALLCSWVLICLFLSIMNDNLSFQLVHVWMSNILPYFLLATAASIVISCGQIDISTGGVMSVAGMLIVSTFHSFGGDIAASVYSQLMAVIFVLLIYMVYAFAAVRGISTLIVTLSLLLVTKGASSLLQACLQGVGEICRNATFFSSSSAILPNWAVLAWVNSPTFLIISYSALLSILIYWRYYSRWGLEHIAVGMDTKSASFCRIPINQVYLRAFLISGALVALATLLRLHGPSNGGWAANTGWGDELIAIAIAVIGGTRISGGVFNPVLILVASFGIYLSRDIITNDLGVPAEVASILLGGLMLAIVAADFGRKRNIGGQVG